MPANAQHRQRRLQLDLCRVLQCQITICRTTYIKVQVSKNAGTVTLSCKMASQALQNLKY